MGDWDMGHRTYRTDCLDDTIMIAWVEGMAKNGIGSRNT